MAAAAEGYAELARRRADPVHHAQPLDIDAAVTRTGAE